MGCRRLAVFLFLLSLPMTALILSGFAAGMDNSNGSVRRSDTNTLTFTKDVAPIFFTKCAACHRPGASAPMSLLTYKEARPWAKSIKEKVIDKTMPPWHADPAYGKFANDRSLSKKE